MATPPDFSSGAVLTAAQMNGIGSWLVKSQAVGSAVSSVTVTGAFSSDYDNYRIVYTGGVCSTTTYLTLQFGIGATMTASNYVGVNGYANIGASTWNILTDNATAQANYVGGGGTSHALLDINVDQPNLTKLTAMFGQHTLRDFGRIGFTSYIQDSATQFTSLRIAPVAGTLTGGTIRVYGYRN